MSWTACEIRRHNIKETKPSCKWLCKVWLVIRLYNIGFIQRPAEIQLNFTPLVARKYESQSTPYRTYYRGPKRSLAVRFVFISFTVSVISARRWLSVRLHCRRYFGTTVILITRRFLHFIPSTSRCASGTYSAACRVLLRRRAS